MGRLLWCYGIPGRGGICAMVKCKGVRGLTRSNGPRSVESRHLVQPEQ